MATVSRRRVGPGLAYPSPSLLPTTLRRTPSRPTRRRCAAMLCLPAVAALLLLASSRLHQTASAADAGLAPFVWIGNVTSTSFAVSVDISTVLDAGASPALTISRAASLVPVSDSVAAQTPLFPAPHDSIRRYVVGNLTVGTLYHFGIGSTTLGSVTTFPKEGNNADVHIMLGSCQRWADRASALAHLASTAPKLSPTSAAFMIHLGDLHCRTGSNSHPRILFQALSLALPRSHRMRP
jgi:hypothetical protein